MSDNQEKLTEKDFKDPYEYGFETEIDSDFAPKGLNEEIVKFISNKKNEPKWLLEWRLAAYRRWLTMEEPNNFILIYKNKIRVPVVQES